MPRLVDLEPEWWAESPGRFGQGLSFRCPHCDATRIAVAFKNPVDGGEAADFKDGLLSVRMGAGFDKLTVRPLVNARRIGHGAGFITDGEVTWGI